VDFVIHHRGAALGARSVRTPIESNDVNVDGTLT